MCTPVLNGPDQRLQARQESKATHISVCICTSCIEDEVFWKTNVASSDGMSGYALAKKIHQENVDRKCDALAKKVPVEGASIVKV